MLNNEILHKVIRPARYTGGEWNSIVKDWENTPIKVALAYPDTYEIGMSNMAIPILYEILNRQADVLAERVYAPWVDMEAALRREQHPPFQPGKPAPAQRLRHHRVFAGVRALLHQRAEHAGPGRHTRPRCGKGRFSPADYRRGQLHAEPGADGRLHRCLCHRRRRRGYS